MFCGLKNYDIINLDKIRYSFQIAQKVTFNPLSDNDKHLLIKYRNSLENFVFLQQCKLVRNHEKIFLDIGNGISIFASIITKFN